LRFAGRQLAASRLTPGPWRLVPPDVGVLRGRCGPRKRTVMSAPSSLRRALRRTFPGVVAPPARKPTRSCAAPCSDPGVTRRTDLAHLPGRQVLFRSPDRRSSFCPAAPPGRPSRRAPATQSPRYHGHCLHLGAGVRVPRSSPPPISTRSRLASRRPDTALPYARRSAATRRRSPARTWSSSPQYSGSSWSARRA